MLKSLINQAIHPVKKIFYIFLNPNNNRMRFFTITGLLLLIIAGINSHAQNSEVLVDPILVHLKGRIINTADSTGVPYATIVNNRNRSGTITNNDGYFSMEVLNIDSLVITSIGYQRQVIYIPHNYMGYETLTFTINPVSYAVGEVDVTGEKPKIAGEFGTGKPVDIPVELRGDAFNEKPPILAALFNPISYWNYYLSKREREKRDVREAIALQNNWEMHSENYNKQMVMKLTGLNEATADSFMVWFNSQNVLPYTSTEYEVRASIKYYFELYKKEKHQ
jgi:hypothetical protein